MKIEKNYEIMNRFLKNIQLGFYKKQNSQLLCVIVCVKKIKSTLFALSCESNCGDKIIQKILK